jgi:hypothetical protein
MWLSLIWIFPKEEAKLNVIMEERAKGKLK